MSKRITVREFDPLRSLFAPATAWHWHWPDSHFAHTGTVAAICRAGIMLLLAAVARLRGVKLVWTVHNLQNHEGRNRAIEWAFFKVFKKLVSGFHCLTVTRYRQFASEFEGTGSSVVYAPHGHYGPIIDRIDRDVARASLGLATETLIVHTGKISGYKGVEDLIQTFRGWPKEGVRLVVAGLCPPSIAERLRDLAADDARIQLTLRPQSQQELDLLYSAADLAIFPYRKVENSGSVLLAVSYHCPVLVPDLPTFRELKLSLTERLVRTYAGNLDIAAIERCLKTGRFGHVAELHRLDWDVVSDAVATLYGCRLEGSDRSDGHEKGLR